MLTTCPKLSQMTLPCCKEDGKLSSVANNTTDTQKLLLAKRRKETDIGEQLAFSAIEGLFFIFQFNRYQGLSNAIS